VQRRTATKVELLEARHTGVRRQVDAMFEFVFSVPTIAAALQAQYGEPISQAAIRRYRQQSYSPLRQRIKQQCASQLRGEGRLPIADCRLAAARNLSLKARSQQWADAPMAR
jgi:hypothetical protein